MKKLLFVLLLILNGSFIAFSQNYLTNGQVYNFSDGDVFETESGSSEGGPPIYGLTIVLAKWYSALADTVFYKDSLVYYVPPACPPPCVGTFNTQVDTVFYTNLSFMAAQATGNSPCPITLDTIYYDTTYPYCNRKVWEESPSQICIDSTQESLTTNSTQSWLIEGCGGPYYILYAFDFNNDIPYTDYYSLIYYKKHDTVCGSEYVISSINSIEQLATSVDIYPNPSKGRFNFAIKNYPSGIKNVEVFNILGEKVYTQFSIQNSTFSIDISSQPDDIYFYRVISETGSLLGDGKLMVQR